MPDVLQQPHLQAANQPIPRLKQWDSSFALMADPYRFIGKHCRALGGDVFETRLMLQRTLCMSGVRAARLFHDPELFRRTDAAPQALKATLFGKGGVQGLDDAAHRHRKALFTNVLGAERVGRLTERVRHEWRMVLHDWAAGGAVPLYRAVQPVLARAVCHWAGVPLSEQDVPRRTRQLTALFDAAAGGPWQHLRSRFARLQAEAWLARLIEEARAGHVRLQADSAAHRIATHRDQAGALLPPAVAAVELLNLLRPTVAVSVYIAFVAHALHMFPAWKAVLAEAGTLREALAFVQEVRRHYPFFPATVARVRQSFDWQGMHFPEGRRVMLDLYGTNHDPRAWDNPHAFLPERWRHLAERPDPERYDFIPQGGGDVATRHRCPGEDVAIQLMVLATEMLLRRMRYEVPRQDLHLVMDRLPAIPRHGLVIDRVRPIS